MPVAYPGGHLIDGGVSSLVPVRFARAMGAGVVIAVDIYCKGDERMALSVPGVLRRSMRLQTCLLADSELSQADIVIRADVPMPKMSERPVPDSGQWTRATKLPVRPWIHTRALRIRGPH